MVGQRYISGICKWHPQADSALGGKVAVVPVELYKLFPEEKRADVVGQTITRRSDGYFELIAPTVEGEYTFGVRIERAEGCPEKFQHRRKEGVKKKGNIT